jgi:hypothetical protein
LKSEEEIMRDPKCDVLADIDAGRIVSPKRLKSLIRINETMIKSFERFGDARFAGDVALHVKKLRAEIGALRDLLAASDKIIDDLEAAIYAAGVKDAQALKDMKIEWEAYSAGISSYWTRHIKPGAVDLPRAAGSEG